MYNNDINKPRPTTFYIYFQNRSLPKDSLRKFYQHPVYKLNVRQFQPPKYHFNIRSDRNQGNFRFTSRRWAWPIGSDLGPARSCFAPEYEWSEGAGRAGDDRGGSSMGNRRALCSPDEFAGLTFAREVGRNHEVAIPSDVRPDARGLEPRRASRFRN